MNETQILNKTIDALVGELNPKKILLFGSRAKGKNSKNADFDIAVDAKKPNFEKQRKIEEKIESIAGLHKVDVVYLGSVDEEFREIIVETGKIVYEKGN